MANTSSELELEAHQEANTWLSIRVVTSYGSSASPAPNVTANPTRFSTRQNLPPTPAFLAAPPSAAALRMRAATKGGAGTRFPMGTGPTRKGHLPLRHSHSGEP